MSIRRLTIATACISLVAACAKEPPPRTLSEYLDDPVLLEAALVRCDQNRAESRYEAECVNAREAVKIIEAKEDAKRREEMERQSQRKREALRRTQEAAAEARRRMADAERRRREDEYLEQFGELPPDALPRSGDAAAANAPGAVIPDSDPNYDPGGEIVYDPGYDPGYDAVDAGAPAAQAPPESSQSEPVADAAPEADGPAETDLQSVRDELRRRSEESQN